jgi:hypothetical protein
MEHARSGFLTLIVALAMPLVLAPGFRPRIAAAADRDKPVVESIALQSFPPVVDGVVDAGEWTGEPQIVFDDDTITDPAPQVVPTYVYFRNSGEDLYVLVDAVGDTTSDVGGPYVGDECLLLFGAGDRTVVAEVFGDQSTNLCDGTGAAVSGIAVTAGFGASPNGAIPHRIYEWKIPLATLGASAGQDLDFVSPLQVKFIACGSQGSGSMPYDATSRHDNVWPPGISYLFDKTDRTAWGILRTQESPILFMDEFSDGTAKGDPDWKVLLGAWKTVRSGIGNRYLTSSKKSGKALAVVDDFTFKDGRINVTFKAGPSARIPGSTRGYPRIVTFIFDMVDVKRYRAARLQEIKAGKWKLTLFQEGKYHGDRKGIKDSAILAGFDPDSWHDLSLDVYADGRVTVYLDATRVLEGTFGGNSGGKVGFLTQKTAGAFDDVVILGPGVLP